MAIDAVLRWWMSVVCRHAFGDLSRLANRKLFKKVNDILDQQVGKDAEGVWGEVGKAIAEAVQKQSKKPTTE